MAEELGITASALVRWSRRHCGTGSPIRARGRPEVIPASARERIRACYLRHYRQWGPRVLAAWCLRRGLGSWSPTTIAVVIADLRPEEAERKVRTRYEITGSDVMWSEDGTGLRENGKKKELLVVQDEHARLKLRYRLVEGPADEEAVYESLKAAFERYGAPLVLKHDGGSIFHGEKIQGLMAEYQVTDLTGPRNYPQYNGKKERSMRDIKSYERAMRLAGVRGRLRDRLEIVFHDLNEDRPRPVLGGCTAREIYDRDRIRLPDRQVFREEVNRKEKELRDAARSRSELESARRRAVELALLRYGLMKKWRDVSRISRPKRRTD
jgi:transposase InsO family protein